MGWEVYREAERPRNDGKMIKGVKEKRSTINDGDGDGRQEEHKNQEAVPKRQ